MPMTGYALREAIREVLGHFWSESFGQIYPALAELERDGYVERRESARNGSSTFRITPSGTAQLRELLSEPIQRDPPRNGLLLRLFLGRHLGPAACRALVLDARAEAERRLAEYVAIRADIAQASEMADERPYQLLTLAFGEHTARAAIAWANEAVAALDQLDSTRPSSTHLNKESRT
jgi:DNA-binding PadR family transcriptional regulator